MAWKQIAALAGFLGILALLVAGMFRSSRRKPDPKGNEHTSISHEDQYFGDSSGDGGD